MASFTSRYTVIKNFSARLNDELSIAEGDIVELISDDSEFGDGWYMGKNLNSGKVGLYPKVFTKLMSRKPELELEMPPKPNLLRSRSRRTPNQSPIDVSYTPTFDSNSSINPPKNLTRTSHSSKSVDSLSMISSTTDLSNLNSNNNKKDVHGYVDDIDKALKELSMDQTPSSNSINQDDFKVSEINLWSPQQVAHCFTVLGFEPEVANHFIEHKISGSILLELELSHLKELDISSFGTRYELFKEIEELKSQYYNSREALPHNINNHTNNINTNNFNNENNDNESKHLFHDNTNLDFKDSTLPIGLSSPMKKQRLTGESRPSTIVQSDSLNFRTENLIPSSYVGRDSVDYATDTETEDNINHQAASQFLSPRKAPEPPSYPSPVAKNPMKFGLNSPEKDKVSHTLLNATYGHSRQSSFGGGSSIYLDSLSGDGSTNSKRNSEEALHAHKRESTTNSISKRLSTVINMNSSRSPEPSSNDYRNSMIIPSFTPAVANTPTSSANERRSVSAKEFSTPTNDYATVKDGKRIQSTNTMLKDAVSFSPSGTPPSVNSSKPSPFRSLTQRKPPAKTQTSAFQEGIQNISVDESIQSASYSGWMFKRGNLSIGSWKQRFFTLHKTRLSYFTSLNDSKERGLIDITSHKVLPANDTEDKISAVYAATAGYGRYIFKLVPPAPGSRMGLTFTQQKVHYFAVESKEEMREWMAALMKATIEVDESVPVISSCVTPTIPLQKAQELMAVARETAQENLENLQKQREEQIRMANVRSNDSSDTNSGHGEIALTLSRSSTPTATSSAISSMMPRTGSVLKNEIVDADANSVSTSELTSSRDASSHNASSSQLNGMSTPYLVTSGLLPNTGNGGEGSSGVGITPNRANSVKYVPPVVTRLDDEYSDALSSPQPPAMTQQSSFRRVLSLRRLNQ